MPGLQHGPSIKYPRVYEALRRQGYSKGAAARISNAVGHSGGRRRVKAMTRSEAARVAALARWGKYIPQNKPAPGGTTGKPPAASSVASRRRGPRTPEQREAERQATTQARAAERAAKVEQNIQATFAALDLGEDAADSLRRLAAGEVVDDDGGLVKAGLAEQAKDGSFRLTAAGRAVMHAAERGDLGAARDARSRATDTATARAERDAAKKLEAQKPQGGGGGGKKKEPPVKLPPRQTSQAIRPVGGGGGGAPKRPEQPKQPQQPKPAVSSELQGLAQRLSDGHYLEVTEQRALIRNGLARQIKGELVLTAAGQRATKKEASSWLRRVVRLLRHKAVPTRVLHAGHTGVMIALHPDAAAAELIAALPATTEPLDQLHITLCYLGNSTEAPLATNKDRLIACVAEWATLHGFIMDGVINGVGRFFNTEDDGTNAVYVSPDMSGLPSLRESLTDWLHASGFDYADTHGYTPHITIGYVPADAATPDIRIDPPFGILCDRVTLAWGDEQYVFPLRGVRVKATAPGDYLVVADRERSSTWRLPVKKNGTPDHRLMGAAWAALHGGYRGNTYDGPQQQEAIRKLRALYAAEGMPIPSEKALTGFAILKDASGAYRWVAFSSTAYQDRDQETVSTKALEDDCVRADADGQYGPLRWWHVPGMDLGTCDFNAMHGRILVESGTFKDAAIAHALLPHAPTLALSIGFVHSPSDPDAEGVFHHIRRFERSLVPAGRASNLFTQLFIQEQPTMATLKERWDAFKALVGDDVANDVARAAETTQKGADERGVAFKGETDVPAAALVAGTTEGDALAALTATVKAQGEQITAIITALKAAMEEEVAGEAAVVEEQDDGAPVGRTLTDEDLEAIRGVFSPLIGMLDIEKKIAGHVQGAMAPYQAKKDAEEVERQQAEQARAAEVATLKTKIDAQESVLAAARAQLAELLGEQPRAWFQASTAKETQITPEQAVNLGAPAPGPFDDLKLGLFGIQPPSGNGV